jgi:hypothetical protein
MMGYYLGDNVVFLTASGMLDNHHHKDAASRLLQRQEFQGRVGTISNRCFFVGALTGLLLGLQSYYEFLEATRDLTRRKDKKETEDDDEGAAKGDGSLADEELARLQRQRLLLLMGLGKSCCDVLVFSNNPGVDLWKKWRGTKMNDGLHATAGMLSAASVLFTKWPTA